MKNWLIWTAPTLLVLGACFPTIPYVDKVVSQSKDDLEAHDAAMGERLKIISPENADELDVVLAHMATFMNQSRDIQANLTTRAQTLEGALDDLPTIGDVLAMVASGGGISTVLSRILSGSKKEIKKTNDVLGELRLALATKAPKDEVIPG